MADLNKMDRTWLCSVLFMDIVNYSSQSVDVQMEWKKRFNGYLAEAIRDVPESERVILDTGDGAAVCFLGAPEAAMFAALHLWQCFVSDEREHQPGLRVRTGVNLGPVKLVKDLNGNLNAIGDGINTGQRIMSFAPENQILASQSYFEVVSCLSDDYKKLFQLKGVETDKHVREHTVYNLLPPGSGKSHAEGAGPGPVPTSQPAPILLQTATAPPRPVAGAPQKRLRERSRVPLLTASALAIFVVAVVTWRFAGSWASRQNAPAASVPRDEKASPAAQSAEPKVSNAAQMAYDQGIRLIDEEKPAEAVQHFDDAIRANPDYVLAYLGRAQARRLLSQYEMSIEDCNHAMRIKPEEPRVYFCRGLGEGLDKRYDLAVRDYGEAIRLNPKFAAAYEMRGDANVSLQEYGRALEDFNKTILLKPNNVQSYLRRAAVYENLKQYEKAIQDFDQVIRLEPGNVRAYNRRANAKKLSGDLRGAAADQQYLRQLKEH
jgi:Tfp pilus assembly protein PilF/class 3 adenylate cyclase